MFQSASCTPLRLESLNMSVLSSLHAAYRPPGVEYSTLTIVGKSKLISIVNFVDARLHVRVSETPALRSDLTA